MKSILTLVALHVSISVALSSEPVPSPFTRWMNESAQSIHKYKGYQLVTSEANVVSATKAFIKTHYPQLADARGDLSLNSTRKSVMGHHISFKQVFDGMWVYGTEVKVNISKDFKIVSVLAKTVNTQNWQTEAQPTSPLGKERIVIYKGGDYEFGWMYETYDRDRQAYLEVLEGDQGFWRVTDLGRYLNKYSNSPDSLVYTYVFYPDPIQSEETIYQGAYKNHNGRDTSALTNARKLRTTYMRYLSDSFWAENKWVKADEPANTLFVPANSRTDTFDFTRSDPRFEQVNALFHITNFHTHMDSLGFDSLANYQITVNTRAFASDQSRFNRVRNSGGKGDLEYGYGAHNDPHVDDAEDADVIIHEYGHAVSFHANGNDLATYDRRTLDEGICDYLACSYSRNITEYNWEELYNWDGHNEFWDGRMCTTNKDMDDYSTTKTIYDNGEIFAGAMMEVWDELGRDTADALMLGALYHLSSNTRFRDIALIVVDTDSLMFNGSHTKTLCDIFTDYKFVDKEFCITGITSPEVSQQVWIDAWKFTNQGEFYMEFSGNEAAAVRLFDASGKEIFSNANFASGSAVNMPKLGTGIYVVEVQLETGVHRQKLLRN